MPLSEGEVVRLVTNSKQCEHVVRGILEAHEQAGGTVTPAIRQAAGLRPLDGSVGWFADIFGKGE